MSDIHNLKEAGIIVGEAGSNEFYFASQIDDYPSRWEYIVVYSKEFVDGREVQVPVIAQVEKIISASQALSPITDIEALKKIIEAGLQDIRTWGKARVLGYLIESDSKILQPRRAVAPGIVIYIAPRDLLEKFYSFPVDEGLNIGSLISRGDVPVYLSLRGFRRHLAIIAQTGAGKSYCAGVLVEELLKKGATVLILDPHADYVLMSLTKDDSLHQFSDRITVYRNSSSIGRYSDKNLRDIRSYEIAFEDLGYDEVCDIAGIREGFTKIREAVRLALDNLKNGKKYTPKDLLAELQNVGKWSEEREVIGAAFSATKYIRRLSRLKVFGPTTTSIADILKPMQASIIDLSGLEDRATDYIASKILSDAYNAVASNGFPYPIFLIIEEAHKFIPPKARTYSAPIINKIAAEGRKFGIFLTLITQRPSKVDSDSLSQCNSQIIMKLTNPQDQEAVEQSSERMSTDLLNDLPGLNPGEAVIVGEVTRAPVMVKVRRRLMKEGGADIDIISRLKEAQMELADILNFEEDEHRRVRFTGSFQTT